MENDLNNHIDSAHGASTSYKTFICKSCGKNFQMENDLNNHMNTIHGSSTSKEATRISNVTNRNPSNTLKPICKSVWLDETCKTQDCPRAHPPRCNNPV